MAALLEEAPTLWASLLEDAFEAVLVLLEAPDVGSCRLVCRAWNSKVLELAPKLCIAAVSHALPVQRFRGVKQLQLTPPMVGGALLAGQLARVALLQRLRVLCLQSGPYTYLRPSLEGLHLLAELPCLESLTLEKWSLGLGSGVGQLQQLRRLTLQSCTLRDGCARLMDVLAPLASLTALECNQLCAWDPQHLNQLFTGIAVLHSLTSCALTQCAHISDALCGELAKMPRLRHVDLGRWGPEAAHLGATITDQGASELAGLPALQHLSLRGHGSLTDAALEALGRASGLTFLDLRLPKRRLPGGLVSRECSITDAGLQALAPLRRLTALRLSECAVGVAGCRALAGLTQLTALELGACLSLTDTAVCALLPLHALRSLSLHGCRTVTDLGVAAVAREVRGLQELDLSCCHEFLTDVGFASLRGLDRLRSLNLASCERLTDVGLVQLAPHLGALASLDLRDCDRITDAGVAVLARQLPCLTSLNLEHCHQVSNEGVKHLAAVKPLRTLRLFGTAVSKDIQQDFCVSPQRTITLEKESWWMRIHH